MDRASEKRAPFCINVHVVGVPGEEGRERKISSKEITAGNTPGMRTSISTSQELSDSQAENTETHRSEDVETKAKGKI